MIVTHDVYFLNEFNKCNSNNNNLEIDNLFDDSGEIDSSLPRSIDLNDSSQEETNITSNDIIYNSSDSNINDSIPPTDNYLKGDIYMTNQEKLEFMRNHPNATIEFIRPNYSGKNKIQKSLYRINNIIIPKNIQQALQSNDKELWKAACDDEYLSLVNNETWTLVERPVNERVLPCFWLFTNKIDKRGIVSRYKARLVALGNLQSNFSKLDEYSSPVIGQSTFKLLLAIAVNYDYQIRHLDVKTAFLMQTSKIKYSWSSLPVIKLV